MFSEAADDTPPNLKGEYFHTTITFSGNGPEGSLNLCMPRQLCMDMAANVLGTSPEETSEALAEDALKELSNIICGELTAALYGNTEVFHMSVPSLYRIDKGKWQELSADVDCVKFLVADQLVFVCFMASEEES